MEKIRILFLITDLGKGGAERFLIDFCLELQKRNDVEFLIGTLYNLNEYKEQTSNLPIVYLDYKEFRIFQKADQLNYLNLINSFNPHIIHTHRFLAEFLSAYYVNKNIKYVCHGHDNMVQFNNFKLSALNNKEALLNYFEKQFLIFKKYKNSHSTFIANSYHTFKFFKKVLPGFMNKNVIQINYGFNFEKFYKKEVNKIKAGETLKLINIGSFQDKKNQAFMIPIALELRKAGIPFEIHLIGDGLLMEHVIQKTKENKLERNIIFHGKINNVEQNLWNGNIYLHTAYYEPFGLVFLEAMAAGLPCIALNGKGNSSLIQNGKNGYLINEQNPTLFAQKIIELYQDSKLYHEITKYCKEFASDYKIEKCVTEHMKLYQSLLKN